VSLVADQITGEEQDFNSYSLTIKAGIKSLRATLPDEIFTGDFAS
jgi:hypothetical protein